MTEVLAAWQYFFWRLETSPKWLENFQWVGTLNMQISAVLVSVSAVLSAEAWVFVGFLFAHLIWGVAAYILKNRPLLVQSVMFIPLDLWAMYIRL